MSIRAAREPDRESVWPLARDFATSFVLQRDLFDTSFSQLVGASDMLLLVAEVDGRVVGYLLATSHVTFLANGPAAWVEELMVRTETRRRGVGAALMGHVERWAASNGAAYVALATRRAAPFYAAQGYDESATYFKKAMR